MKLNRIFMLNILMFCTIVKFCYATDIGLNQIDNSISSKSTRESKSLLDPFADTWSSLTNENDTWGMQDRVNKWYFSLMFGGSMGGHNMRMGRPTGNVMIMTGYIINKYLGVQYNQMATYGGLFTGIGEGVIMIPTGTMVVPFAVSGAGWSNMSGKTQGAWDIGGGLNFALSESVSAIVGYRYVQTIAGSPVAGAGMQQPNARASMSMVDGGIVWYF